MASRTLGWSDARGILDHGQIDAASDNVEDANDQTLPSLLLPDLGNGLVSSLCSSESMDSDTQETTSQLLSSNTTTTSTVGEKSLSSWIDSLTSEEHWATNTANMLHHSNESYPSLQFLDCPYALQNEFGLGEYGLGEYFPSEHDKPRVFSNLTAEELLASMDSALSKRTESKGKALSCESDVQEASSFSPVTQQNMLPNSRKNRLRPILKTARARSQKQKKQRIPEVSAAVTQERNNSKSPRSSKAIKRSQQSPSHCRRKRTTGANASCKEQNKHTTKSQVPQQGSPYSSEPRKPLIPSRYCHICTRITRNLKVAVCENIKLGTCRKVTCEKCVTENSWNTRSAWDTEDEDKVANWICTHCRSVCPSRAQCSTYNRINQERRTRDRMLKSLNATT